jgi:CheY-like chemotaxis protein
MSRILLVDDDEDFRRMLCKVLEKAGHEVRDAANGKAALELYRQEPGDLIITDLVMPVKEGLESIREFRRLNPSVKIIAISGGGRMDPRLNLVIAQHFGARQTLAKPFSNQEILDAVALVLGDVS